MILGEHTVVIRRATTTEDTYGNPVRDWGSASSTPVTGCSVQPLSVTEVNVGRDTLVTRWQLFAPVGTDLLGSDRVEFDGDTYEVDGDAQVWDFATLGHVTAALRKAG